jgi:hypothetical protein
VSDETDTPGDGKPGERLAEIRALRVTDSAAYWDENIQAEERALLGGASAEEAKPADQRTPEGRELAAIKHTLSTTPDKYWADPEMQARHLELVEIRLGEREAPRVDGVDWGPLEQGRQAGLRTVAAVKHDLQASGEWELLESSFDGLSDEVHVSVQRELMRTEPFEVKPASSAALEQFAATPAGKALVKEWGPTAARNLARVQARVWCILDALTVDDCSALAFWLDAATPTEAKAVLKALAR